MREHDAFDPEVEPEPLPSIPESTRTIVVNRKHVPVADDLVPITRPSIFGNPYPVTKNRTRKEAIEQFKAYFLDRVEKDEAFRAEVMKLRGKTLVCCCSPLLCHGDVIAAWLDSQEGT